MASRNFKQAMEVLFSVDESLPCPSGTALLLGARPLDFGFLEWSDLINLRNITFSRIEVWGSFSDDHATCEHCNV